MVDLALLRDTGSSLHATTATSYTLYTICLHTSRRVCSPRARSGWRVGASRTP